MFKKIIVAVSLLALVNVLYGCTKTVRVLPNEGIPSGGKIVAVVMPDGQRTAFDRYGGTYDKDTGYITGTGVTGEVLRIKLDDILYLQVKKADPARSLLATVGVLAIAAAVTLVIVALTKESCPFVYSWNGESFVFDAEPLGGAICEGLRRVESSRLDHIRPDDGQYRLLVQNEVKEIQYLDRIQLQIVDHPIKQQVAPDQYNQLYSIGEVHAPVVAVNETGMDLTPFVSASDGVAWQSKMPVSLPAELERERHHHTYKFLMPPNTDRARLVYNIGTTLWGSNMIRETLQLRGTAAGAWYEAIQARGPEYQQMQAFLTREEIWHLGVVVDGSEGPVNQGYIRGAGPLAIEDRVMELDLSRVEGDTLTIEVTPPFGFWIIDNVGIQYDYVAEPVVTEVALSDAVNHQGESITESLTAIDSSYYVMHEVGDWCELVFDVPPPADGTTRTVFLESAGYYEIQFDEMNPPQVELLTELGMVPGASVRYAFDRYLEFVKTLTVAN